MKVAQVCHVYLPHLGGLEYFVDRLHESLKKKGVISEIVTTDMKTPLEGRKSNAIYYKSLISYMGNPFSLALMNHFKKNRYDLIILHQIWFIPSFEALSFKKNAKTITVVHGVYPDKATKKQKFLLWLYKPIAKYVLKKSDHIIVQSNSEKDKLLKIFKINKNKVNVIYNGTVLEKNREKIESKERVILFTGRIIPDKNPDLLIKAGVLLSNKKYDFKIKFIGTIEDNYKEELIKLANNLGIKDKVMFIPNIPKERRNELMKEYASAFTSVAVGSWEGLPNRLMEAMQFGVPCVAYNSGGTAELVKDGETGLLIKNLDEKELASKIEFLMKNSNLYRELGKNAKKIVRESFDWDKNFKKISILHERK